MDPLVLSKILKLGKHSYYIENLKIEGYQWHEGFVNVGSFCSIGSSLTIWLGGNHRTDWVTTYPFGHIYQHIFNRYNGVGHPTNNGDVNIGNDVWIASGCTIMSGVTIGDGAVIAANSHVVKDIPAYSIAGGNPAKVIKQRFTTEQIEELLDLKWWDFSDEIINQLTPFLCSNNIEIFLAEAKKYK